MNVRIYILTILCYTLLWGCSDKDKLEPEIHIQPDYILPQGNASKADNDRIQALKDKYGSYFLYVVTQKDFSWSQSTGSGNSAIDSIVLGDPKYTGAMLDYIDDIWLKYLPESMKKGAALPYRVMMVDSIKRWRGAAGPPGQPYLVFNYKILGKGITIAGMNASLGTLSKAERLARKNELQKALWEYYVANGIVTIPAAFYTKSNYATTAAPLLPVTEANSVNNAAYRNRGFLPGSYFVNTVSGAVTVMEWYNGSYAWTQAKSNDLNSYLLHLIQRNDAEMAKYLQYPLIKEKFDLLVNHFKNGYGIDVRAIANDRY
ncbi:hypothetical protein [Sphingobacterium tabacisoli]|uniref:Lipoprotein n=1 Tax=Sphingobacterium tabacisoli TaxID=2044855 RepID=A0ABW5KZL0_9SPHI|nr:hypothetical protein [Sphingobacterium tabacisoli]